MAALLPPLAPECTVASECAIDVFPVSLELFGQLSRSKKFGMKIRGVGKNAEMEVAARLVILALIILVTSRITEGSAEMLEAVARRRIRGLSYPEDSEMGLFFALAVPLDDSVSTKSISVAVFFEANYHLPSAEMEDSTMSPEMKNESSRRRSRRNIDRKMVYEVLESKFEDLGYPGRQCLLRSICETAREGDRLHAGHNGLVGDLMRIALTVLIHRPSSSLDESELSPEYSQAEKMSQQRDCADIYKLCPFSIYHYITDVLD
ncbi:hypothetical protein TSAR_011363 [Trichomalopsis sarcophagae]|uniref:Uncharacterized protein n=1 Tax=Trichomalopsis sarcophagae TaxID=543379 RepID=A0A232EV37_9HYME|nr:hypothetical protein TSAR_011363 [Trichomalopsis sarcophagae]